MYRIWIDQDDTLKDMLTPWYRIHNEEYPDHVLMPGDISEWDHSTVCTDAGCEGDMHSYFARKYIWEVGEVKADSQDIIMGWQADNLAEIGVLTTSPNSLAPNLKLKWLEQHFPFIRDVVILNGGVKKASIIGDILIDDGWHNIKDYKGIGILYDSPVNRSINTLRAKNWNEVDEIVRRAISLFDKTWTHKEIQQMLHLEQQRKRRK